MFYLLGKKKLHAIDPDRIYTYCPAAACCTRWTCKP